MSKESKFRANRLAPIWLITSQATHIYVLFYLLWISGWPKRRSLMMKLTTQWVIPSVVRRTQTFEPQSSVTMVEQVFTLQDACNSLGCQQALCQQPDTSTATNPRWTWVNIWLLLMETLRQRWSVAIVAPLLTVIEYRHVPVDPICTRALDSSDVLDWLRNFMQLRSCWER